MKNKLQMGVLVLIVGIFSFALLANAQSDSRKGDQQGRTLKQSINVEPSGQASVRGTLLSVASSTLTIKSWGISFIVDISNTKVARRFATTTPQFVVGDFIDVSGRMSTPNSGVISARNVRNVSAEQKKPRGDKEDRMGTSTSEREDNKFASSSPDREGNDRDGDRQEQQSRRGGVMNFIRGLFGR